MKREHQLIEVENYVIFNVLTKQPVCYGLVNSMNGKRQPGKM